MKIELKKIGVAFLALLILLVPVIIYVSSFHDFDISKDNQDWANFGSYIGGTYTLFASLVSVATLFFVLYQYYSQKEQQERLSLAQLEIINFQKYQAHYQQFLQLIDSVEKDDRYCVSIINKSALYKDLFPENSFTQCSYIVDLDDKDDSYLLNDVKVFAPRLKQMFSSTEISSSNAEDIVTSLSKVYDSLYLKLNRPEQNNDIVFQVEHSPRYIILNTDNLREATSNLWAVLDILFHFSGNTAPEDITYQVGSSFTVGSMECYKKSIERRDYGHILISAEEKKYNK